MSNQHQRDARLILGAIVAVLIYCACIAFLGDQSMANNKPPRVVKVIECGRAINDEKPGYRITRKARFIQYEDGSGRLMCGTRTVVIVRVPW